MWKWRSVWAKKRLGTITFTLPSTQNRIPFLSSHPLIPHQCALLCSSKRKQILNQEWCEWSQCPSNLRLPPNLSRDCLPLFCMRSVDQKIRAPLLRFPTQESACSWWSLEPCRTWEWFKRIFAFSKNLSAIEVVYLILQIYGANVKRLEAQLDINFLLEQLKVHSKPSFLCLINVETSTGVRQVFLSLLLHLSSHLFSILSLVTLGGKEY